MPLRCGFFLGDLSSKPGFTRGTVGDVELRGLQCLMSLDSGIEATVEDGACDLRTFDRIRCSAGKNHVLDLSD